MNFKDVPEKLLEECKFVEARLAEASDLKGDIVGIEVLPNFDTLPESQPGRPGAEIIRRTFAAYRGSTEIISVNANTFFGLTFDERCAVLAHELGHRACHLDGRDRHGPIYVKECVIADRLACYWGFLEGLASQRRLSSGERYAACLELWPDPEAFFECATRDMVSKLTAG